MLQTLEREPQDEMAQVTAYNSGGHYQTLISRYILRYYVHSVEILSKVMTVAQVYDTSPAPGRVPMMDNGSVGGGGVGGRRDNPHKYLLYKPSLPQLQVTPWLLLPQPYPSRPAPDTSHLI